MLTRNLRYANAEGTLIDMEIEHPIYGWIPFTASPDDTEEHGRVIYQEAKEGRLGDVSPYVEPEPLPEPLPEPKVDTVTTRQARLQLLEMGLLDSVEAAIGESRALQIEWDYATEVRVGSPITEAMVVALNLTEEQLDEFFKQASMR